MPLLQRETESHFQFYVIEKGFLPQKFLNLETYFNLPNISPPITHSKTLYAIIYGPTHTYW